MQILFIIAAIAYFSVLFYITLKRLKVMKEQILQLQNDVHALTNATEGAKTLLVSLKAKLDAGIEAADQGDLDQLKQLSAEIEANTDGLAAAVAANTPAA